MALLLAACMTGEQQTSFSEARNELALTRRRVDDLERCGKASSDEAAELRAQLDHVHTKLDSSLPRTPAWLMDTFNLLGGLALFYFTGRTGHQFVMKKRARRSGSPQS